MPLLLRTLTCTQDGVCLLVHFAFLVGYLVAYKVLPFRPSGNRRVGTGRESCLVNYAGITFTCATPVRCCHSLECSTTRRCVSPATPTAGVAVNGLGSTAVPYLGTGAP